MFFWWYSVTSNTSRTLNIKKNHKYQKEFPLAHFEAEDLLILLKQI